MDNGQYEKDIKHDQTHCGSPKSWGLSGDTLWVSVRLLIGKNCQPCFIHVRETILLFLTTFTTVPKTNNTVLKFPLPPRVPRFLWAFWQLPCLPSKWRQGEPEQEPQQEQAEQAKKEQDEPTRTDNNSYDNDNINNHNNHNNDNEWHDTADRWTARRTNKEETKGKETKKQRSTQANERRNKSMHEKQIDIKGKQNNNSNNKGGDNDEQTGPTTATTSSSALSKNHPAVDNERTWIIRVHRKSVIFQYISIYFIWVPNGIHIFNSAQLCHVQNSGKKRLHVSLCRWLLGSPRPWRLSPLQIIAAQNYRLSIITHRIHVYYIW